LGRPGDVASNGYRNKYRRDLKRRAFFASQSMDDRAFTDDSLTMMYESIRGTLASDEVQKRQKKSANLHSDPRS
jgi:hypothetical protein